jgi:hypothetical protein
MNAKQVAVILSIISVASVLFSQVDLKPEVSQFESFKAQFNMKFSSFENAYREKIFL